MCLRICDLCVLPLHLIVIMLFNGIDFFYRPLLLLHTQGIKLILRNFYDEF